MEGGGENVAMIQHTKTSEEDNRINFQGKMDAPLFAWPWENLGNYKVSLLQNMFQSFFACPK